MDSLQEQGFESWPDRDLVVAFKGGVPDAYDEMYRRYSDRVQLVCRRMLGSSEDAREATQETFLKAYVALPRFNGQYKLGAWLSRIASNVCVDHIRQRARSATLTPLNESHEGAHLDLGPEDVVIRDIPALRTLEDLQPLHAKALELRNLEGFSHKEIADQLGMSPMQVKALLHRARVSFKRAWDNASGWVLAPLVGLRHLLHQSSKDASSISAQLPVWSQAASPLLVEKVAASAMVVAIALSGAGSSAPAAPVSPAPVASAPFSNAELDNALDTPTAASRPRTHAADATLVADIDSLLDEVRETAERKTDGDRPRKKDDRSGNDPVGPTNPDRASRKLISQVRDTAEDVLPHR